MLVIKKTRDISVLGPFVQLTRWLIEVIILPMFPLKPLKIMIHGFTVTIFVFVVLSVSYYVVFI